jgi:iron complex outermembrane receptor protein
MRMALPHRSFTALCCNVIATLVLLPLALSATNREQPRFAINPTVTVGFEKTPVITAFNQIELLTDMKFCYSREDLAHCKDVTLEKRKRKLSDLLEKIGEQTALQFAQMERNIAVKPAATKAENTIPAAAELNIASNGMAMSETLAVAAIVVKGKILSDKGEPLPGVTVKIKGTATGSMSDANGNFSLQVPDEQAVLQFTFIGYLPYEEALNGRTNLEVVLKEDTRQMNEVVVTALGIKREAKKLGYSVQKVGGDDIIKAAPPTVATGLMGKVAGLNISTPNGVEGSSSRIVIRGNTSINGSNQPLIVIDGIPVDNDANLYKGSRGANTDRDPNRADSYQDWGSVLNFINSDDIEEVNVLKGPTAAALYGARGANGVLMITMKKGNRKPGLGVDYNFSYRVNQAYRYQELQNEYGYGGAIALWMATPDFPLGTDGKPRYAADFGRANVPGKYASHGDAPGGYTTWNQFSWYGTAASWGPKLDGREITWWDGTTRRWDPQPDNIKSFFRDGHTGTHNVSVSGGGDMGNVRLSYTRTDNTSIIPNSNFNQNTINLGSQVKVTQKLTADVSASYTVYNRLNSPDVGDDNNSWAKFMTYGMSRDYKPLEKDMYKYANGSKFEFGDVPMGYPYAGYGKDIYWNTFMNNVTLQRNQLMGNVKLNAELTSWLSLTGRAGINQSTNDFETKKTPTDSGGVKGAYGHEMYKNTTRNLEFLGTLHKDNFLTDGFNASFTAGANSWYQNNYGLQGWNGGEFAVPNIYTLANVLVKSDTKVSDFLAKETRAVKRINSTYGLLDLSYKNYLFLQLTGRNDWSSTLPSANNSYFYPSASLSFVFTEAWDLGNAKSWLDFGKVRAAYAGSASDADPYASNYTFDTDVFGGAPTRSIKSTLPPVNLLPQRSKSYEGGIQLSLLKSRLSLDFTYYTINSTNQIIGSNIAPSSGVGNVVFNTGELQNKGFEFIVRGRAIDRPDFQWDVTLNGAHNQNKLLYLADGAEFIEIGSLFGAGYGVVMRVTAGQNYGTIYGYDYTYKDGKKVVKSILDKTTNEVIGTQYVTGPDVVPIGNATPWLTGGVSNTFRFKGFSLYALVDFKWGGDVYSGSYSAAMGNGLAPATLVERNGGGLPYTYPDGKTANTGVILDGVFADGKPNTNVVPYMWKYAGVYSAWSDIHIPRSEGVFENSWMKMREVTLSYQLPKSLMKKTGFINGLSLSLIGRDLFYLYSSLPDRLNPEGVNGIGNAQGIEFGAFPGTRSYGFSVKASF